jgi:hypothetical protein
MTITPRRPSLVASCEFAKAASLVVYAEFKVIAGARLNNIVDEVFGKFFRVALNGLLAQPGLILWRHELTPRGKPFGLGYGEQLRLVGFSLDIAYHGASRAPDAEARASHRAPRGGDRSARARRAPFCNSLGVADDQVTQVEGYELALLRELILPVIP